MPFSLVILTVYYIVFYLYLILTVGTAYRPFCHVFFSTTLQFNCECFIALECQCNFLFFILIYLVINQ